MWAYPSLPPPWPITSFETLLAASPRNTHYFFLWYRDQPQFDEFHAAAAAEIAGLAPADRAPALAGERAASPKTISSYRDAIKLLLTWFNTVEHLPPEKLRLADIDRTRILRFLDWLEAERNCSAATRNQRLAVIKSFCRYTAVEQPDHLDQVTQVLAIRQKNTAAPAAGAKKPDLPPSKLPSRRSTASPSEAPTFTCVTRIAVITAQKPCGAPTSWAAA